MVLFSISLAMAQPATDQFLVVPGQRIGPVRLGMTLSEATQILGTPQPGDRNVTSIVLPFEHGVLDFSWAPAVTDPTTKEGGRGYDVIFSAAGAAIEVQAPFDPRYGTVEGVHIDSLLAEMLAKLGPPDRQKSVGTADFKIYDRRGLAVLVVNDRQYKNYGKVNGLWVFAPR
jgi:hypothetical protein